MSTETAKIAAIYVGVSNHRGPNHDSFENQKSSCIEKIRMEDLEFLPNFMYEDDSTSTKIMDSEGMRLLIEDAKKGLFSIVVFTSLSRLSLDTFDTLTLKRILVNGLGLRLISLEEDYDSGVYDDELKFQLMHATINMGLTLEEVAQEMVTHLRTGNK